MLPVGNRPMLERVVAHLAQHGVDRVVLSLGYRPDAFREAYPDGTCAGVELHYAVEPEPRDTAGAIRFAADDAGIDERFLVVNGDVLTDLDVTDLVARHEAAGAEATLALHRVEDPSAFGVVPTEADGRVIAFIEKPPRSEAPTDLINAGTYVLEPSVVGRIEPDLPVNVERVTFPAIAADGALYAFDGDTYWIDAGTPASLLEANLDLLTGARGVPERGVHPDARVAGTVTASWLGSGVVVAEDAEVTSSLVLPGATIRRGAVVRDAIIGPRAEVGEGATVEAGSVLGDDVQVAPGDTLRAARVPAPVP
jgi:mannose-1-phosphate guanylyltransferase